MSQEGLETGARPVGQAEPARTPDKERVKPTVATGTKRAVGEATMEAVVARENMLRALRAVEGNAGQSGSVERDEAAHAANGGGRGRLIPCDPSHTVSMERRNASFMRDCQP